MTFNLGSEGNVYLTGIDSQDHDTYGFDYQASPEYSDLLGSDFQSLAQSSSNWTFSPPAMLESPPTKSPLSNGGVRQDLSWNPLDQPFTSIQNSIDNSTPSCPSTPYQAAYGKSNIQSETQPFVSLAAINNTATSDDIEDGDSTPRPVTYQTSPRPSPTTRYTTRQPNWGSKSGGGSSDSPSSSETATSSKRRKSSGKEPRPSHSRSKSDSTPRLRSTQSLRSTTFRATVNPSCETPKCTRTNHNQVEKQYRNRLNGQFEVLLQTLPRDDKRDGADQRISKAEMLVLAKRHIVQLESKKRVLEEARGELEGDMEEIKRRFVAGGGIYLP